MIPKSARRLVFHCNCIGAIDVGHPIPLQAPTAGASLGADHQGKGHVQIAMTSDSDEGTDVDVYLNTAMFST
jgi:hypothetical protein